ncbi:MAG: nicotinate phosphoribosyltransferase, partial [Nitrospirota bacterium]|nr:nicotinate phosphoribosyltransferase [Nitrospirota bacterium]
VAARASYVAGFVGTATVLAEPLFGIPLFGTMAHSFVQAHDTETGAFSHFAETHPEHVILLIDTYDTEAGATKVVQLAPELKAKGIAVKGVRLDSGDLIVHARNVRRILDAGGLPEVHITASGNLDEHAIQRIVQAQAPIDVLAVGTRVATSADVPYLDCVYKLQEYAGRPCQKQSEGKATWPGPKQVYRGYDRQGRIDADLLTTVDDLQEGESLLQPIMIQGKRIGIAPSLADIRSYAATQLACLPDELEQLDEGVTIEVRVSQALRDLRDVVDAHGC